MSVVVAVGFCAPGVCTDDCVVPKSAVAVDDALGARAGVDGPLSVLTESLVEVGVPKTSGVPVLSVAGGED